MALSVYKDHSFLIFNQDDKICKYDFATKTTYGWSGRKVNSLQTQLRNISIKELIDGESEYWNTENSNKNAKIVTTQRDYLAGITSTDITRRFLLPEDIVKAQFISMMQIILHKMPYTIVI